MNKRILTRLLCILFVTVLSVYFFAGIPPTIAKMRDRIHLGLDLRGGVQLVPQVVTDDAIRAETDQAIETMRQQLQADKIAFQQVTRNQINELRIDGVDPAGDGEVRRVVNERFTEWDMASAADNTPGTVVLRMKSAQEQILRNQSVQQAMRTIGNRLDSLGVGEVVVQEYGSPGEYAILVQVPGTESPERVKSIVQSTALLEFRLVDSGPFTTEAAAGANYGGSIPAQLEALRFAQREGPDSVAPYYVVQRVAPISGRDLRNASTSRDETGHPAVAFKLSSEGARRFGGFTEQSIGRPLAIVLDQRIQSVAQINGRIEDSGIIQGGRGGFTIQQVQDLTLMLKSGALPASIRYLQEQIVGPSLGADSIRQGIVAAVVALSAVTAFMVLYYKWSGVNATIAMLLNLVILLGALAYFDATLTLPGIAGFVLTIGVGIDSNVLIFERIREEIHSGKTAATAVGVSFNRVFMTLVDTHLAALISAAFLFAFGTGAIQGFAVTLVIGLVSNMFTAVFVSHTLFDLMLFRKRSGRISI